MENDLENLIYDSGGYKSSAIQLFYKVSSNYILDYSKESPVEIALSFLKMGQENPNESFTRVYIFDNHYFFKNSDLKKLIKELFEQYPTTPELARFNKKYIKQDKINKKEMK